MIRVVINGARQEMAGPVSLVEFLKERGLDRQFVAVAYNGQVVEKEEYPQVTLQDGDSLEIVRPVGGG